MSDKVYSDDILVDIDFVRGRTVVGCEHLPCDHEFQLMTDEYGNDAQLGLWCPHCGGFLEDGRP